MSGLRGRVVVLSPHPDDAVFSLGAAIHRAVRSGARVEVLTVLAGDPASGAPAGSWDARSGFRTAAEAARARRAEDDAACAVLGAIPRWLPFSDAQYGRPVPDGEAYDAVAEIVADADRVLVPGFPLANADHAWLARLVLSRADLERIGLYVEWPYAYEPLMESSAPVIRATIEDLVAPGARFTRARAGLREGVAKWRAVRRYRSQVRHLGRLATARLLVAEHRLGGEMIGDAGPPTTVRA